MVRKKTRNASQDQTMSNMADLLKIHSNVSNADSTNIAGMIQRCQQEQYKNELIQINPPIEPAVLEMLMLMYEVQYKAVQDSLTSIVQTTPGLLQLVTCYVNEYIKLTNQNTAAELDKIVSPTAIANANIVNMQTETEQEKNSVEVKNEACEKMNEDTVSKEDTHAEHAHSQEEHDSESYKYYCFLCKRGYRTRRLFYFHNRQVHDIAEMKCDICAKPVKNRAALTKHRRRHLGDMELRYVCGTCGRRCKERRHLVVHCKSKDHELPDGSEKTKFTEEVDMEIVNMLMETN